MITNALEDKPVPVYGDGLNRRDWIWVADHCKAVEASLLRGQPGGIYNAGAAQEKTNLEVVRAILDIMGKPHSLIQFVTDRPAHDRRYALDAGKIQRELGWRPSVTFQEGMARTVEWYLQHRDWWQQVKSGEYAEYYRRMYSGR